MTPADPHHPASDPIAQAAAEWVLRLDRGLTPVEQDDYMQWLAADPRHRDALAAHRWGWDELDRLAGIQDSVHAVPDPDLLRLPAPRVGLRRHWAYLFAAAAVAALAAILWWPRSAPEPVGPVPAPSYALAAPIEERSLEDGSVIALNRGAVIEVEFTAVERRVHLVRGEASFTVAKQPARPFIVHAGGVDVCAVGTAFNVRLDPKSVEVLVTEGRVQVTPPLIARAASQPVPFVEAGQRTVVSLDAAAPAPRVSPVSAEEESRALAWRPRLLDFTDEPLVGIVGEFNRRNPVRLIIADPAVAALRLSATVRSDNVEGFVRLLEADFGVRADWRSETEIALRRQ
jgi:transmembrane sensor